jgi:hypothetical protein
MITRIANTNPPIRMSTSFVARWRNQQIHNQDHDADDEHDVHRRYPAGAGRPIFGAPSCFRRTLIVPDLAI